MMYCSYFWYPNLKNCKEPVVLSSEARRDLRTSGRLQRPREVAGIGSGGVQELSESHLGGLPVTFSVDAAIRTPFGSRFDPKTEAMGPCKSTNFVRRPQMCVILPFSARVASGTQFWTLPGSVLGGFWPPRWLKPLLEFLLERPRAVQAFFFRPQERPKRLPRAPHKPLEVPPWPTKPC